MGSLVFVACFFVVLLPRLVMSMRLEIHMMWPLLLPNAISYITGHAVGRVLATKKLTQKSVNDSTNERKQDQQPFKFMAELIESQHNQQNEFVHQIVTMMSNLEELIQQKGFLAVEKYGAGENPSGYVYPEEGQHGLGSGM